MDPNATWEEMVRLAESVNSSGTEDRDAERFAELILALRDWLAKGGFSPAAFTKGVK